MSAEHVQELLTGALLVRIKLLQEPGVVISLIVCLVVRSWPADPVLLIVTAQKHRPPAPLFRTDDHRIRVKGAHRACVFDIVTEDFVVSLWIGMDVAMSPRPE